MSAWLSEHPEIVAYLVGALLALLLGLPMPGARPGAGVRVHAFGKLLASVTVDVPRAVEALTEIITGNPSAPKPPAEGGPGPGGAALLALLVLLSPGCKGARGAEVRAAHVASETAAAIVGAQVEQLHRDAELDMRLRAAVCQLLPPAEQGACEVDAVRAAELAARGRERDLLRLVLLQRGVAEAVDVAAECLSSTQACALEEEGRLGRELARLRAELRRLGLLPGASDGGAP